MHRHQLHPGAVRLGNLYLHASLPLLRSVEVGEEGKESGVLAGGHELLLGDLDQPVDVEKGVGGPDAGAGRQLDVEVERADHRHHQVGQRRSR